MHTAYHNQFVDEGAYLMWKSRVAVLLGLLLVFATGVSSQGEERLAINELYSCEIVLHELIADLRKLRVGEKRAQTATSDNRDGEEAARPPAGVVAFDQAIALATAKYARCP
jgi:hypothetical protein